MNSRWQANKIGLINFWYYDEQEFPFVKGRMLLRGSNGSGKSVTMQSVVPLLLDGNMSPERLDPFGSRDRKMSSYLLEEDDGREERTGYLYLEFKRQESDIYLTIGMGIRARRGKPLDKWYFSLTDGRRIGKDFFLYKNMGEKVTLSKRELENRIAEGGRVFDRQADYMEYVNKQVFGFETVDEYKEMLDLLIQLRTPKLSKDFKPSVINDILSDSLQPLSDDDLRPMSEAIENMDNLTMNLKGRKEAYEAAGKINSVLGKYNKFMLYDKAGRFIQAKDELTAENKALQSYRESLNECRVKVNELEAEIDSINIRKETLEKERESLSKSDAVALKNRETKLSEEIEDYSRIIKKKENILADKEAKYVDLENQKKNEENRKYEKEKEIDEKLDNMESDAEDMAFQEFEFMRGELTEDLEREYNFQTHNKDLQLVKERIIKGESILAEVEQLNQEKEELVKKRDRLTRELDTLQRKISELESVMLQVQNEWKENLFKWNDENHQLKMDKNELMELSTFADHYNESSDFATVKSIVSGRWIDIKTNLDAEARSISLEIKEKKSQLEEAKKELAEWENQKEPVPPRSEAVIRNRKRLEDAGIPYHEFYKVIEFGQDLNEEACNRLEEALMNMGILDAIVVDEQYRKQVLEPVKGCEDRYLFASKSAPRKSLLDVLELNDEVNDIFSNQRIAGILGSIAYDGDEGISVSEDGTYYMGVLTGTVTGEHEAGFLGTRARERNRQARMAECRNLMVLIEEEIAKLEGKGRTLDERMAELEGEYGRLPDDADMRAAFRLLADEERKHEALKGETEGLDERLSLLIDEIKDKKTDAIEIARKVYLDCTYEAFRRAKVAVDSYEKALIGLQSAHELLLRSVETLGQIASSLEAMDEDLDQVRYDIGEAERKLRAAAEERASILEQLKLTDYEAIRERLDECVNWLNAYPGRLQECVRQQTQKHDEMNSVREKIATSEKKIVVCEGRETFFSKCYEQERKLGYVEIPEEIGDDAKNVYRYLQNDVRNLKKDVLTMNISSTFMENKVFLGEYKPTQVIHFAELDDDARRYASEEYSPQRMDIVARYQGTDVSFASLISHLDEDISELENLIKDGDRELFEDILANTISRKIRGKINSSNMWVQKMNALMNSMDTSSSLKLSLRWKSKTADNENQLDTRELVELLKKDYRVMSEDEAEALSNHFKSKVEEARRNARDSGGMVSFYQIMKETLDYRKWFEFQLISQKKGERQKELTNSVFGTFSGGEKAMSMYVPLFSAVVAKYQGGREDAPRLISLDEAFAGVDNRNIRDMFRLMAQFGFDFIINSQVLWGDCDTLDALAIYQLVRPENAKFVTVMPYLWNGFSRELLDSEEDVEERGTEIEQLS